jgi:hypothetical protein
MVRTLTVLPAGSEQLAAFARSRNLPYQPAPESEWYRAWEPFDTVVAPSRYFNAIALKVGAAQAIVVEPWNAADDVEPLGRAVFAFVSHPHLLHRAAARIGASHLTRVAFLGSAPPKQQSTGDPDWDDRAITYAESPLAAVRAFTPSLRKLLLAWKFEGHMEMRPGGFVFHLADARPTPGDYDRVAGWLPMVIEKALKTKYE